VITLLDDQAISAAARRVAAVLPEGERLAVRMPNTALSVIVREAAAIAGRWLVPVNPALTAPEVEHILSEADAPLLDAAELYARAEGATPAPRAAEGAVGATVLFTSGTTGLPRGCRRTAAQETARVRELTATYGLSAADVHLIVCPLAHSAPGILQRAGRAAGARTVLASRFEAEATWQAIAAHRVTVLFLVPTQVERLLGAPVGDVSSLRAVIVAGAPFPRATRRRFEAVLGEGRLWEFYGASETGTIAVLPPGEDPGEEGCVGRPPPGVEVELRQGEVFVRSEAVADGYLGEPTRPREEFFSVGDLARRDAAGRLVLVDRKHDLIITGGVNVIPAEVERALLAHPAVSGCVVAGVPDREWGERVVALVALRAALSAEELLAFARTRLAPFKRPKQILFVDAANLPIGPTGKPLRRKVAAFVTAA
jgi:acyl-CoA synthetase (AMP-forming)/AMP-acid ligase II